MFTMTWFTNREPELLRAQQCARQSEYKYLCVCVCHAHVCMCVCVKIKTEHMPSQMVAACLKDEKLISTFRVVTKVTE
jgi:hypothetical protein